MPARWLRLAGRSPMEVVAWPLAFVAAGALLYALEPLFIAILWYSVKGWNLLKHVLTIDNLWHFLVALAFNAAFLAAAVLLGWPITLWPVAAALALLGLFLRELSQVGWKFTDLTFHKHAEWVFPGLAAAVVSWLVIRWIDGLAVLPH